MNSPIYNGNSVVDVCIREYSDISQLFSYLQDNNISLDTTYQGGELAVIRAGSVKTAEQLQEKKQKEQAQNKTQEIVYGGQNLPDLALQTYGSIQGLFQILSDNNLAADQDLVPGSMLRLNAAPVRKDVTDYFSQRKQRVKTDAPIATEDTTGEFNEDYSNDFNT